MTQKTRMTIPIKAKLQIGRTNEHCRLSELKKQNKKCISRNKIESKFVTKLPNNRILFRDIFRFLGLDYR